MTTNNEKNKEVMGVVEKLMDAGKGSAEIYYIMAKEHGVLELPVRRAIARIEAYRDFREREELREKERIKAVLKEADEVLRP